MTVEVFREVRTGRTGARFVIDGQWTEVFVVGPFNDWPTRTRTSPEKSSKKGGGRGTTPSA